MGSPLSPLRLTEAVARNGLLVMRSASRKKDSDVAGL